MRIATITHGEKSASVAFLPDVPDEGEPAENLGVVIEVTGDEDLRRLLDACAAAGGWTPLDRTYRAPTIEGLEGWLAVLDTANRAAGFRPGATVETTGDEDFELESEQDVVY